MIDRGYEKRMLNDWTAEYYSHSDFFNFGYWRLSRDGSRQLRFADHTFEATSNTFISTTHKVDQVTHEGTAGLDAHIGSQLTSLEPYRDAVVRVRSLIQQLRASPSQARSVPAVVS